MSTTFKRKPQLITEKQFTNSWQPIKNGHHIKGKGWEATVQYASFYIYQGKAIALFKYKIKVGGVRYWSEPEFETDTEAMMFAYRKLRSLNVIAPMPRVKMQAS